MFFNFLFFILGLIFGSFISAFSWRYPKGLSVVKGRSICPRCKRQIEWYDNIPVLSFIFLGGRCRNCKKPISLRYPLIELFSGFGFLYLFTRLSPNYLEILYALIIFSLLLLIFVIDLEHKIIPDGFVFFGIALVLLSYLFLDQKTIFVSLLGAFIASSFFMILNLVTKGRGMGLGDVKFAIFGGLLLGARLIPVWLFIAFLTGGIVGIILILGRKAGLKDQIAFGPFLIFSIAVTLIWGEQILKVFLFQ